MSASESIGTNRLVLILIASIVGGSGLTYWNTSQAKDLIYEHELSTSKNETVQAIVDTAQEGRLMQLENHYTEMRRLLGEIKDEVSKK